MIILARGVNTFACKHLFYAAHCSHLIKELFRLYKLICDLPVTGKHYPCSQYSEFAILVFYWENKQQLETVSNWGAGNWYWCYKFGPNCCNKKLKPKWICNASNILDKSSNWEKAQRTKSYLAPTFKSQQSRKKENCDGQCLNNLTQNVTKYLLFASKSGGMQWAKCY